MKRVDGQVTVFISMVMMCVFALFCGLVESGRTAGARWYLQTAASSALDSVFGQYHRPLWDAYRLLFAEYEDREELEADFSGFLQPYLDKPGWFPMEPREVLVEEWKTALDGGGAYLEQEILDYMRYGVWDLTFDGTEAVELWERTREAAAVKTVAEGYRGRAKEALKLEKALEAISESQRKQLAGKREGLARLRRYDGPGFRQTAEGLIREFSRMPGLVAAYRRQADKLAARLEESREVYEREKGSCRDPVKGQLEEEIRSFEEYVDVDGQRRREVEALTEQSRRQIGLIEAVIREARETERIIEEWESDDEEDDGPDLAALWAPVIRHFDRLTVKLLSFPHGVRDKKKEGWLKQVEKLYHSGLLELVLPEGADVSKGLLEDEERPSRNGIWMPGARGITRLNHLTVNEYCSRFFRCFRTEEQETMGIPGPGGLAYEVEYLIGGRDLDEENLVSTVRRLLAVREGLNLLHILSDGQKRQEARTLAMAVTGAAGFSPLLFLTSFFIMSVWALGEALMDVRGLLAGKSVVLFKTAGDWTLGLDQLLDMGRTKEVATGGGEEGIPYLSWLKILLFMDEIVEQEYRMMDLIQMNIRRKQAGFRMRRCLYETRVKARLTGKHVFFSLGFMERLTGGNGPLYPMEITVERRY